MSSKLHNRERAQGSDVFAMPVLPGMFEDVWDPKLSIRGASLRLDELQQLEGWVRTDDGVTIDPAFLAMPPKPLNECPAAKQLHEKRLLCPAIQADRFAREVAQNIFPNIIDATQQIIPAELYKARLTG